MITDFTHGQDVILLSEGVWFKGESHGDYNGDLVGDTRLTLSSGGTITLLGVNQIQTGDVIHFDLESAHAYKVDMFHV